MPRENDDLPSTDEQSEQGAKHKAKPILGTVRERQILAWRPWNPNPRTRVTRLRPRTGFLHLGISFHVVAQRRVLNVSVRLVHLLHHLRGLCLLAAAVRVKIRMPALYHAVIRLPYGVCRGRNRCSQKVVALLQLLNIVPGKSHNWWKRCSKPQPRKS